jgi:hypothetical protein
VVDALRSCCGCAICVVAQQQATVEHSYIEFFDLNNVAYVRC